MSGLTSQVRGCAASIAARVAEGCGQRVSREFHRFRDVGTGAASELEYRFLAADDLNLIDFETGHRLQRDVVEVRHRRRA